jgi:sugar lactone lactonase YvrE
VDDSGNVYIDDNGNSCIRKVNTSGVISTIAGNGVLWGYSGDGGMATSATLSNPTGIALDAAGNLYIADWGNNRIRKVTKATGIITTIVGDTLGGYSGDNGADTAAQLFWPRSVVVDAAGNIYIGDQENNVVRMIDNTGIITTVAGNGTSGYSGNHGPAIAAELQYIAGLAVDAAGHLFIADEGNNVIREVGGTTGVNPITTHTPDIQLYPVPNNGTFNLKGHYYTADETAKIEIINVAGQEVYTGETRVQNGNLFKTLSLNVANGIYLLHITTSKENNTLRFVICR